MDTLIFYEGIVEPPTDSLAIRGLCINAFKKKRSILLETERLNRDMYYKWAKDTGLWDFIDEMICPDNKIYGLRLSTVSVRPPFIKVDRVSWDNVHELIRRIH